MDDTKLAGSMGGAQTQPTAMDFANDQTNIDPRTSPGYAMAYPVTIITKILYDAFIGMLQRAHLIHLMLWGCPLVVDRLGVQHLFLKLGLVRCARIVEKLGGGRHILSAPPAKIPHCLWESPIQQSRSFPQRDISRMALRLSKKFHNSCCPRQEKRRITQLARDMHADRVHIILFNQLKIELGPDKFPPIPNILDTMNAQS